MLCFIFLCYLFLCCVICAQELYAAGEEKWGTDEAKFIMILGNRSMTHLRMGENSSQGNYHNSEAFRHHRCDRARPKLNHKYAHLRTKAVQQNEIFRKNCREKGKISIFLLLVYFFQLYIIGSKPNLIQFYSHANRSVKLNVNTRRLHKLTAIMLMC